MRDLRGKMDAHIVYWVRCAMCAFKVSTQAAGLWSARTAGIPLWTCLACEEVLWEVYRDTDG